MSACVRWCGPGKAAAVYGCLIWSEDEVARPAMRTGSSEASSSLSLYYRKQPLKQPPGLGAVITVFACVAVLNVWILGETYGYLQTKTRHAVRFFIGRIHMCDTKVSEAAGTDLPMPRGTRTCARQQASLILGWPALAMRG